MIHIAALQMASGPNIAANLAEATRLLAQAAAGGVQLCVLPENFALMGMRDGDTLTAAESAGSGPIQDFLAEQAIRHGMWIVGGSIPLRGDQPGKVRSACLVINAQGDQMGRYDKLHLFDASLTENPADRYQESNTYQPGHQTVVVDTPIGKLGLAICYDLRFPELFRVLSRQGAEIFAVPSAFTAYTGRAHWETLVRARAIENLAYVIAANQGGYHVNGRETYGDSMIVDPWGIILARHPRNAGVVCAQFDRERLQRTREALPALQHRRIACGEAP